MSVKVATVQNIDFTNNQFIVSGTFTTSGNYAQHGVTVDLSIIGVPSSLPPTWVNVAEQSASGTSNSGWQYQFNPGTTQANGALQIFNSTTELTATTFPAVTLFFQAFFPKL